MLHSLQGPTMVYHRDTGLLEKDLQEFGVRTSLPLAYRTRIGRAMAQQVSGRVLARISEEMGRYYNTAESVARVEPFIEFFGIDTSEFLLEPSAYATFNQFFYRELKPSARPIASPKEENVVVSPADSRLLVFPSLDQAAHLWIKGPNANPVIRPKN